MNNQDYETLTSNHENNIKKHKSFKNLKTWQKVTCIAGLALVLAGAGGATAYILTHKDNSTTTANTTPISSATFSNSSTNEITLQDGKNEITSGGVYHITGSTSNGWLTIDTSEAVEIILDNVTISTSENQAIRSKQENSVLIKLIGTNKLTSSVPTSSDTKPAISIAGSLTIEGEGSAEISSTGKGIKAVYALVISSGTIDITKSSEGLEAADITISGGDIKITASDDGINASSTAKNEATGESTTESTQSNDPRGMMMGGGGMMGGIDVNDGSALTISGGKLYINASGDGIDSNGNVTISGGEIYVDGPANAGNGALDYNGEMTITGGTLIAVGMSGMAQNATTASQPSLLINLSATKSGQLSLGDLTFTPTKSYNSILISSPTLSTGQTYDLKISGSTAQSVTISDNITTVGTASNIPGGGASGDKMQMNNNTPSNTSSNIPTEDSTNRPQQMMQRNRQ
ncbi:carbohydrate-binding domain-containing protein [Candidatus Saccharibacteria bacterium]|nr:carbohydrate-binding domain-containing protein [Candidatus Saccharibacteria bacterium]